MKQLVAFTIVSKNYIPYAMALRSSFLTHHEDADFKIFIADRKDPSFIKDMEGDFLWIEEIGISRFESYALRYSIIELNTNVKPSCILALMEQYKRIIYLDPDIYVFHRLDPVLTGLDVSDVLLTPHITSPMPDDYKSPQETDFLISGTFNLGFIAVKSGDCSRAMLEWWREKCLTNGFIEMSRGLFVDQKWMNLAPMLFNGVSILKSPGLNVAYWNLHERQLIQSDEGWLVNDIEPLYFFHFSGVRFSDEAKNEISKHLTRYMLSDRPDLLPLFDAYRKEIVERGIIHFQSIEYGFRCFSDGEVISNFARRLYAVMIDRFGYEGLFDSAGAFHTYCKRQHLFYTNPYMKGFNTFNADHNNIRFRIINLLLKLCYRVIGVERYELLMQYLSYISSSARHQKQLFLNSL